MKLRRRTIVTTTIWLLLPLLLGSPARATDSGCSQAADAWISVLGDSPNRDIFQRHARDSCKFSGHWVKQSAQNSNQAARDRMCNDLVLIWTHKKCGYFRDVINPEAYEPCKSWSREMFQHCMNNDVGWFP
jgi:hypothetical protein